MYINNNLAGMASISYKELQERIMLHFMTCKGGEKKKKGLHYSCAKLKLMREVTVLLCDRGHKLLIT